MTGGRGVCGKQRVIFAGHIKEEETEGGSEEGTVRGKKQGSKQENKKRKL